jgi:hypothetical protein
MKNLFLLFTLIFFSQGVFATVVPVEALEDFTTAEPVSYYSVKVLEDFELSTNLKIKEGAVLYGKIIDVQSPKRLKRDATFTFVPQSVRVDGHKSEIKGEYPAKYTTPLDKKALARTAVLGVGSYFFKGLAIGVNAIDGAIKNEENNRIKSSVESVYENSPLSYVEKGEDLVIKKGESFLLNFKVQTEENLPNYEYTELD